MEVDILPRVSMETKLKVREALGLDEIAIKEAVQTLKTWLATQPHLPDHEEDIVLERWLIRCKNSIEKSKRTLDMYYSLRTYYPELMTGWDTKLEWFENMVKYGYIIALPQLTPDLDRVVLIGYSHHGIDGNYNVLESWKIMLLSMEIRLHEDYNLKDIYVIDFKNVGLDYVKVLTLSVIKKLEACFLLYVHGTDLSEFHKIVPREILPEELGGKCGTVPKHWEHWTKKMKNYSEIFKNREQMKSDESRRPNREKFEHEMFGTAGSFRKLNID